jgi:Pectate lyase superfamily protein
MKRAIAFVTAMGCAIMCNSVTTYSQTGSSLNSVVTINPTNSTGEGAEVQMMGSGTYPFWVFDNFCGQMRLWNNSTSRFSVANSGNSIDYSAINGNGALAIQSTISNGIFPVTAFGADPTGATASDGAFNNALTAAANVQGGGGTVCVPPGQYRLDGMLQLPNGVKLSGSFEGPHNIGADGLNTATNVGSILRVFSVGNQTANGTPFITMGNEACVSGLTIYYPNQNINNVIPFPFTIKGQVNATIMNVTFVNSYQGIDLTAASGTNSHYLKNVNMCALRKGVVIDNCWDIGRLENVHMGPKYWYSYMTSQADMNALTTYVYNYLTAFNFGKTDWECAVNCFVYQANVGIAFTHTSGGDPHVMWTQGGVDECITAVNCLAAQNAMGINFSNAMFVGSHYLTAGPVTYTNCDLIGNPFNRVSGSLTNTILKNNIPNGVPLVVNSSRFQNWAMSTSGMPCISCYSGSTKTVLTGCDFVDANKAHLDESGGTASVLGCIFASPLKYTTENGGTVTVFGNL